MGAPLFGRVWAVTVGASINGTTQGIKTNGHRVSFRVEKTLKSIPNKCECQIYNLSADQRAQIEELRPQGATSFTANGKAVKGVAQKGIPLLIEAGYKKTGLSQIWIGDLRTVYSEHNGADWVTHLETGDGADAKRSSIAVSYGPGTSPDAALRAIATSLGIDQGNAAAAAIKMRQVGGAALFPKRLVLSGNSMQKMDLLCESAGLEWSIQDGAVQLLDKGGVLSGKSPNITDKTGLLESPSIDPLGVLSFKCFILPDVRCGGLVVLTSKTAQGNYRVRKAIWTGDSHGAPWDISAEATRY